MDTSDLIPRLETQVPGALLEIRPFGHSPELSLWIEAKSIDKVAKLLCEDPGHRLDWLENLSVMEIEGALVLNYFVRSTSSHEVMILRASLAPKSADDVVELPTVSEIWPAARTFETEAAELFGVRFVGANHDSNVVLPSEWIGFPLRKSYIFPAEFGGILHMRPVGHTEPDEHGVLS